MPGKDKGWADMTAGEQRAAGSIGYHEASWDDGMTTETTEKWWVEMSSKEQKAATQLGYSKGEWDADKEGKEPAGRTAPTAAAAARASASSAAAAAPDTGLESGDSDHFTCYPAQLFAWHSRLQLDQRCALVAADLEARLREVFGRIDKDHDGTFHSIRIPLI